MWPAAPALAQAPQPFTVQTVADLARTRAAQPYRPPPADLPARLAKLDYDAYRGIRFRPERALWRSEGLPFQAQFFHRGFFFKERVDLDEVVAGQARPIPYDPTAFASRLVDLAGLPADLGYAGLRLHAPINRPDYFDEVAVFQGASYFRSLGRDQVYGLSARGLALNTTGPGGEEFPVFRRFWLERPGPHADTCVIHALLDSPSAAGAWRFAIRPGEATVFEVEARLYPRRDLATVGIAPLTSMYLFGPASPRRFDDFRRAVHDSDGLQMLNGAGERLWRPLTNPSSIQESAFADRGPRGFGLVQRSRRLSDFEDLEARYDRRPSCWIEPQGDWGPGAVHLVELPSAKEIEDNVVAFWRPDAPLQAGREHLFRYRMSWGPPPAPGVARVVQTRTGADWNATGARQFSIDYQGETASDLQGVQPRVSASAGRTSPPIATRDPRTGALRVAFELQPGSARTVELRAALERSGRPASETWMYRWTA
jgi:glucans biosynthesis protein